MQKLLVCLVAALLAASSVFAQSTAGTISGRVVDPSGAPIAGGEVHVINQVDRNTRTFTTTPTGDFVFPNLDPAIYTITAKAAGFKQVEKKDITLNANDRLAIGDVKLEVGAITETVEVTAQAAPIQTASAERSGLLDNKQIMELTARGRDVMALLQTLPGVVDDNTGGDTLGQYSTPTMSGMRSFYNSLNIDGISGNTARGRTAESPLNMDAISEIKVLQNSFPAEYGPSAGGVISIVTKGGTQQFHGGAYYYNRNEAFNANNFFSNAAGLPTARYRYNTTGVNVGGPIYIPGHFNTSKQKLFFYFSVEYLPNQSPNSVTYFNVPTADMRKGDFSQGLQPGASVTKVNDPLNNKLQFPGNIIPANRIDPNSSKLLSIFPLPNTANSKGNFVIAGSEDLPVKQELLRIDYNRSDRNRMKFKVTGFSSDNTGRTSPAIQNQWGLADVDYSQTMPQLQYGITTIFTPTLINEATVGMNLWTEQQKLSDAGLKAYQRATYGINIPQTYPKDNPLGLLPAMSFGGITSAATMNYDGRFPMVDDSTSWTIADDLTKIAGKHEFKAGIRLQRALYNQYHQAGGANFPGNFKFDTDSANPLDSGYAYANAILGNYDTYTEATNRVDYAPITKIYEWYVRDHWKVTSRLTIDAGFRFTWGLPQAPNNNNAGNFVPYLFNPAKAPVLYRPALVNGQKVTINPITGDIVTPAVLAGLIVPGSGDPLNGIITPTTPGYPREMVYSNGILTAPRFGIAWDPFGNGKTAIRAGGGFFYNPGADAGTLGNLFFNPPAIYNPTAYYGTVATAANGTGLLSPSGFSRTIDPNHKIVTAYHANAGIQRDLGHLMALDVAYVGSFGRHLSETVNLNNPYYGATLLPQNQNPQGGTLNDNYFRPYQGYGGFSQQIFEGNSSYHSLQVSLNKRFSHGVQFGVSYTHSKALGYAEGDSTSTSGTPSNSSNTVARYLDRRIWNYGLLSYDRPNLLTFNFLWDVPKLGRVVPNAVVKAIFDGWQFSDITTFAPGSPLNVVMTTNPTVTFLGSGYGDGSRPLLVGNPNLPSSQRTVDNWFNIAAFAEPIPLTAAQCASGTCPAITYGNIGNTPEGIIRGPGRQTWNTAIFKTFKFREGGLRIQFRAEAYNTFNHTNFNAVDTTIQYNAAGVNTRSSSGNITSARDPRIMQFALRINF